MLKKHKKSKNSGIMGCINQFHLAQWVREPWLDLRETLSNIRDIQQIRVSFA